MPNATGEVEAEGRFVCAAVPSSALHYEDDDSSLSGEERLGVAADRISAVISESGANLVVVPPLVPSKTTKEVQNSIESICGGPTFDVLSSLAEKRGVYLGTTIFEAEARNLEVYSTFILIGPDGKLAGKVRNACPAGRESAHIKASHYSRGSHILTTEYGNVAVGLGWENRTSILVDELDEAEADADDVALIVQMDGPLPSGSEVHSLGETSLAFSKEYGLPVVSVTSKGATIVGADEGTEKKSNFVSAFMTTTVKSSVSSKDCAHHHLASNWNPLLPEPSTFAAASLSLTSFLSRLRYGLSIRRRVAAGKVLGLEYDPRPLLSCYAAMILLFLASVSFFLSEEYGDTYLGGIYVCDAFKSLCHGLCVPFLMLQAFVHGLSHAMHVYVLSEDEHSNGGASGSAHRNEHKAEVYHPSVGCLGMRMLIPAVGVAGLALKKVGMYRRSNPWGYLASCVCVAAAVASALAAWETKTGSAIVHSGSMIDARNDGPDGGGGGNNRLFVGYSEAVRNFAVPFILVQILVNACTQALYAYVTGDIA